MSVGFWACVIYECRSAAVYRSYALYYTKLPKPVGPLQLSSDCVALVYVSDHSFAIGIHLESALRREAKRSWWTTSILVPRLQEQKTLLELPRPRSSDVFATCILSAEALTFTMQRPMNPNRKHRILLS